MNKSKRGGGEATVKQQNQPKGTAPLSGNEGCGKTLEKTREEVVAQRQAKKSAKLAAKQKKKDANNQSQNVTEVLLTKEIKLTPQTTLVTEPESIQVPKGDGHLEKTKEMTEKDMKKQVKPPVNNIKVEKPGKVQVSPLQQSSDEPVKEKSKAELKAERRAKQEAQRLAKEKNKVAAATTTTNKQTKPPLVIKQSQNSEVHQKEIQNVPKKLTIVGPHQRVKLFSHLHFNQTLPPPLITLELHPAVIKLGTKYAHRVVCGSNARCVALLKALKEVITDYTTPVEKEFSRGVESCLGDAMIYLNNCRPSSVSMINALKHIKSHLTQLPIGISDEDAKKKMSDVIDTFVKEQIDVAGDAICLAVQKKISNRDVILIYGCSSLLFRILEENHKEGKEFTVVIVDGGPWYEGREMLRRLIEIGINCTYVLVSSLSYIMAQTTKVLLGAHALLANGYVMSRAGSSLVALMAKEYNVPVLVCCETYKFCERVQTDVFVYNELGNPEDFVLNDKRLKSWESTPYLTPLSILYDITPPDLVTAVVTEIAILPCTSVPVILRIKPSDMIV